MYMGELIQKHGYAEAMDFIRKKKYLSYVDKDGDIMYKKVWAEEDDTVQFETNLGASAQSQLTSGEEWAKLGSELAAAFEGAHKPSLGNGTTSPEPAVLKRPAAGTTSSGDSYANMMRSILGAAGEEDNEDCGNEDEDDEEENNDEESEPEEDPEEKEMADAKAKGGKMIKALQDLDTKIVMYREPLKKTGVDAPVRDELTSHKKTAEKIRKSLQALVNTTSKLEVLKKEIIHGAQSITAASKAITMAKAHAKAA